MILRFISLHMDFDSEINQVFRIEFNSQTKFINHFLSRKIKEYKFVTDGSFNMLSIVPSLKIKYECRIVGDNALQSRVEFNADKYEALIANERYAYFLQLLEDGYYSLSKYKNIPMDMLLKFHTEFITSGFKNEWLHKRKQFKKNGFEVLLNCFFTSIDFKLILSVVDLSSKKEIMSGCLIRTIPDELYFVPLFKDIVVQNNELVITEYAGRPKFSFKLEDIYRGNFRFEIKKEGLDYLPFE